MAEKTFQQPPPTLQPPTPAFPPCTSVTYRSIRYSQISNFTHYLSVVTRWIDHISIRYSKLQTSNFTCNVLTRSIDHDLVRKIEERERKGKKASTTVKSSVGGDGLCSCSG